MSSLLASLLPPRLLSLLNSTSGPHSASLLTALLLATPFLAYTLHAYRAWHALGGGGLPHSPVGWLLNLALHPFARSDHRAVPAPYTDSLARLTAGPYGAAGAQSFLASPLPARRGPRPEVPTTVAPQRQTTQTAPPGAQDAFLAALARANQGLFALRPSALEAPEYQALWLEEGPGRALPDWFPPRARGELAHVHPEGSMHLVLSLADAARVVEAGWGERHRLSGAWVPGLAKGRTLVPWGYVLVYAPRREGEMRVWRECVLAGARFVAESAGAAEVVVVPEV
ncbi:hypothetical protein F4810DRAFT_352471 [Camillea tinctor]|nr:hypothetical protein F4810DRAFT_352471 [Camillea tinctor]